MSETEGYWRIRALQEAVYGAGDPTRNEALFQRLLEAVPRPGKPSTPSSAPLPDRDRPLGPNTTRLSVETTICMKAVPTGIYPLFSEATDPLLKVTVRNSDPVETKRVRVKAYIEGLSARAVRTVELGPGEEVVLPLLPTLLTARAREVTEIQWATLHVVAADLDGKQERHDTYPLLCLARSSGFNLGIRDEATGAIDDLSRYYGAWVTPSVEAVQERIRRAAALRPEGRIEGYMDGDDGPISVTPQVEALFKSLAEAGIAYVNSVIAYGAPPGIFMQRTRLPRETLAAKSGNCLDGTVLMASLLEGASLHPAIVLVPGHALVAWEAAPDTGKWSFLETTMIGTASFEAACLSGKKQHEGWQKRALIRIHPIADLRRAQIWPME
ncbi:uncharacterized protein SOCE26_010410 [Sorangium cellulosum]|uniref:Transglutaminase-like domain-containing protein n=1 Tax=Sorangium cellulosum TaxID=56 RepID=A0A2L0EK28_SORCE|nr:hypothetical protein [Sorangium cellulosum]AUX39646.1 uncharacterized protein SOCE26_010410 [Sorangium cellulosum]